MTKKMRLQRWHYRHGVFKAGFCGLLLALVLDFISFLAPAWQNTGGLWIHADSIHSLPDWFQVVRALATLSLVTVCLTIVLEVYQDMCPRPLPTRDTYLPELGALLTGFFGLAAVMVFAVQAYIRYPSGEGPFGPCRRKLFWAWGLQLVGSLVSLVSAFLMGCGHAKNQKRSESKMRLAAFKKTPPVGVNPYFVSRSVPVVRIVPPVRVQRESSA